MIQFLKGPSILKRGGDYEIERVSKTEDISDRL